MRHFCAGLAGLPETWSLLVSTYKVIRIRSLTLSWSSPCSLCSIGDSRRHFSRIVFTRRSNRFVSLPSSGRSPRSRREGVLLASSSRHPLTPHCTLSGLHTLPKSPSSASSSTTSDSAAPISFGPNTDHEVAAPEHLRQRECHAYRRRLARS